MAVNILANIEDTTSGNSSGSWTNVPGLSVTGKTVQGTGSVVLIVASIAIIEEADSTAQYRIMVNGSATASPVITAFSDDTNQANTATIALAVDGLSGSSNSFSVQWYTLTGTPSKETSANSSFLVLEITENATIEVDMASTSSANPSASFTDLFASGNITIAGTSSVIIMIGHAQITGSGDTAIDFQFSVDGTEEGAITGMFSDTANEMNGWSGIHVLDGLSAGTHTFELAYRDSLGTPTLATAQQRTFQVIEISSGAALESSIISSASHSAAASWGDDGALDATVNVASTASTLLHIANVAIDDPAPDESAAFRLAIDDAHEGAELTQFLDFSSGTSRTLLVAAKTGLSAGNHTFALQWYELQTDAQADTTRPRSQFVIEFTGIAYKLEGVTKDKDGSVLGSCECYCFKDNGDNTLSYIGYDLSDGSGNYSITGIGDNSAAYLVVAWKDNSPHVMDVTDHVLQPVVDS